MSPASDDAFFEACVSAARAVTATGARTHDLQIAGHAARVCFGGEALEQAMWPALRHFASRPAHGTAHASQTTPLTLIAWDSRTSHVEPPAAPWDGTGFASWWRTRSHREHDVDAYLCGHGTFSLFDRKQNLGIYWVRSVDHIPSWDRAAPFRTVLGAWARNIDGALLHAAAVGDDDSAILLTAKGGSGKSTTAMTCLLEGLQFFGEDYVLVQGERAPRVHALYATAKLDAGALDRVFGHSATRALPERLSPGPNPEEHGADKSILLLDTRFAERIGQSGLVRAIVVPRVANDAKTRLSRLPAAAVVQALAPSTLLQLPFAGARTFARLAAIAQAVPGYALDLGNERLEIVETLRTLLRTA